MTKFRTKDPASKLYEGPYELLDNMPCAVLYRESVDGRTEPCPFCDQLHSHGKGDGHRSAHCTPVRKPRRKHPTPPLEFLIAPNGVVILRSSGYIVRTRSKESRGNRLM